MLSLCAATAFRIESLWREAHTRRSKNSRSLTQMLDLLYLALGAGILMILALYAITLNRL